MSWLPIIRTIALARPAGFVVKVISAARPKFESRSMNFRFNWRGYQCPVLTARLDEAPSLSGPRILTLTAGRAARLLVRVPPASRNQFDERGAGINKRFGRLKTRPGHGPGLLFHTIRKTGATLLEDAQCPEGIAADIIGHDKPTMT
jgi:hypothetical protein